MPKKKILFQITIIIICNAINTYYCDNSKIKFESNLKSKFSSTLDLHHKNLTTKGKENVKPISKPYEVTEEISEYVPVPYHIQRRLEINKTNEDILQVAESRYNIPPITHHQYQVTEDINEEVEDKNNNNDNDILVQGSTYQHPKSPHFINILYNVNNSNNNQDIHNIKPRLYTAINYKNDVNSVKQPLSVIVLPIENQNQVQRPLRVKVLKPVILSNQDTDHDEKENGNIIIRNNREPLLALSVLKSYVPRDNKYNYQNNYHQEEYDEIHEDKPILIKVLKPNVPQETKKYSKLYDTLLHDGYEDTGYRKSENNYKEGLYTDIHKSDETSYKPDYKKKYFIYLVNKEKPYVYTRRLNQHR